MSQWSANRQLAQETATAADWPLIREDILARAVLMQEKPGGMFKRGLDIAVSLLAILALSPFIVLIGLAIRLDSRGPVLFSQQRIGQGCRSFKIYKFRSMHADTDDAAHRKAIAQFARGEPGSNEKGKPAYKPAKDPRVTRVGRWLRATGLDELPQLINVIRGEMSIVGPRPAIPYELELYETRHYRRFAARPGITGLWQVRREDVSTLDEMIRLDMEYVEIASPWLDIRIILATVPRIFFRGWAF